MADAASGHAYACEPLEDHMKYALLIYAAPGASEGVQPADDGVINGWLDYTASMKESGSLLGAEQLAPVETATSVTLRSGERLLTDGPFIETKEHLLGFYLLDVPDLDTALDWAAKMPIMRYGTVEIRPVLEGQAWRAPLE
jgi:hypothetical protein